MPFSLQCQSNKVVRRSINTVSNKKEITQTCSEYKWRTQIWNLLFKLTLIDWSLNQIYKPAHSHKQRQNQYWKHRHCFVHTHCFANTHCFKKISCFKNTPCFVNTSCFDNILLQEHIFLPAWLPTEWAHELVNTLKRHMHVTYKWRCNHVN